MIRLFLILALIVSCQRSQKKTEPKHSNVDGEIVLKPTYQKLKIDGRVNNVAKQFILEANCKDCINEMHVDKTNPDKIVIVLKSRVYSAEYLSKTNPLFTSYIGDVRFNIYSGLEDIFFGDKASFNYSSADSSNSVYKVWTVFIMPDSIEIEKDIGFPFFPEATTKPKFKMQ